MGKWFRFDNDVINDMLASFPVEFEYAVLVSKLNSNQCISFYSRIKDEEL